MFSRIRDAFSVFCVKIKLWQLTNEMRFFRHRISAMKNLRWNFVLQYFITLREQDQGIPPNHATKAINSSSPLQSPSQSSQICSQSNYPYPPSPVYQIDFRQQPRPTVILHFNHVTWPYRSPARDCYNAWLIIKFSQLSVLKHACTLPVIMSRINPYIFLRIFVLKKLWNDWASVVGNDWSAMFDRRWKPLAVLKFYVI